MKTRIILLCIFLLVFQACTRKTPNDTLVIAIEADVKNLDPRFATDAYSQRVIELIYSGLVRLNENAEIAPDLAEKWDMTDDKTYVFYLRKGILFHDGNPITLTDIKYTFDTLRDEKVKSPHRAAFSKISEIKTEEPNKLIISLNDVHAGFLMDLVVARIVPAHLDNLETKNLNENPVGSGPYKFKERKNNKIILEAVSSHFWRTPQLKKLEIQTVLDNTTRIALLKSKKVDLVQNALPAESIELLEKDENLYIKKIPSLSYKYLGFNLRDPILKKEKVRRAIAHAINSKDLIEYLMEGLAISSTGPLSPRSPYYEGKVDNYPYDKKKAMTLLDEAGYPALSGENNRFSLEFKTSTDQEAVKIAKAIANQLKEVGIDVKVQPYEFTTFMADLAKGNFQMFSLIWVGGALLEPDIFHYIFHSSMMPPNGANRGFYENKIVDELLERGRKTVELDKRKGIYAQVQKIVVQELPYVSLWHPVYFAVAHKDIQGLNLWSSGSFVPLMDCYKVR